MTSPLLAPWLLSTTPHGSTIFRMSCPLPAASELISHHLMQQVLPHLCPKDRFWEFNLAYYFCLCIINIDLHVRFPVPA
jgi:hypothetical protein